MPNANTTDNQDELFDVVNEADEVIGQARRREVHANPALIHRAAGAYVFNLQGELLMQKRSMTKDMYPGHWAFSVGGHVQAGDTYEGTVRREIEEELGVKDTKVVHVETRLNRNEQESEYWGVFAALHDGPFPNFNAVEADEVRFFNVDALLNDVANGKMLVHPSVPLLLPKVKVMLASGILQQLRLL